MIPEPQRAYLLELLAALGSAADEFVLVGDQALKFVLGEARATKDFDFLLDAISLREKPANIVEKLEALGYTVMHESRNFQYQKPIPGTNEIMLVEFMAPRGLKRDNDFPTTISTDWEWGLSPSIFKTPLASRLFNIPIRGVEQGTIESRLRVERRVCAHRSNSTLIEHDELVHPY